MLLPDVSFPDVRFSAINCKNAASIRSTKTRKGRDENGVPLDKVHEYARHGDLRWQPPAVPMPLERAAEIMLEASRLFVKERVIAATANL